MGEIFGYARKFVFASIACYPAVKRLPNGENAHVTVRPPVWWKELIGSVAAEHAAVEHYFVLELRIPCAGDATRVRAKRELIRGPPLRLKAMY